MFEVLRVRLVEGESVKHGCFHSSVLLDNADTVIKEYGEVAAEHAVKHQRQNSKVGVVARGGQCDCIRYQSVMEVESKPDCSRISLLRGEDNGEVGV